MTDGEGNEILLGGAGADTFVFEGIWEQVSIADFENGADFIDLSTLRITDNSELSISQVGSDTLIKYGGNSITLVDMLATNVDAADFIFT